jgi:hypothetical protein
MGARPEVHRVDLLFVERDVAFLQHVLGQIMCQVSLDMLNEAGILHVLYRRKRLLAHDLQPLVRDLAGAFGAGVGAR